MGGKRRFRSSRRRRRFRRIGIRKTGRMRKTIKRTLFRLSELKITAYASSSILGVTTGTGSGASRYSFYPLSGGTFSIQGGGTATVGITSGTAQGTKVGTRIWVKGFDVRYLITPAPPALPAVAGVMPMRMVCYYFNKPFTDPFVLNTIAKQTLWTKIDPKECTVMFDRYLKFTASTVGGLENLYIYNRMYISRKMLRRNWTYQASTDVYPNNCCYVLVWYFDADYISDPLIDMSASISFTDV